MNSISKVKIDNQLYYLCFFALIVFHLGDVLRKTAIFFELSYTRYTLLTKIIVFVSFVAYYLYRYKFFSELASSNFFIQICVYLTITFFLGCFFLKSTSNYIEIIQLNIEYLFRYLCLPLTFAVFYDFFKQSKMGDKIFSGLEFIFIVNLVLIISGIIFDISILKTYGEHRFGYSGLFNRANQISYLFILFISFYYYQFTSKKILFSFKLFLTILVSLFVGTKKIYLFLILLLFYNFFKFKHYKKRIFYIIFLSLLIIYYLFSKEIELFFYEKFEILVIIYQEKGLLTSLLSYRDELIIETFNISVQNKWTLMNYVFGGPNFSTIRSEFGFIDIFLFFGIAGLIIYIYLIKYFSKNFISYNFYFNGILLVILGLAFFSSGFFIDPYVPLILLITCSKMVNISTSNMN